MAAPLPASAPLPDLATLSDLQTPWCIRVVVTLGVPQRLARGAATSDELAAAAGADARSLDAILEHLTRKGLFRRVDRAEGDRFELTEAGRGLLEPAYRLSLDLHGIGNRLALAWGTLLARVRSGQPAYDQAFGRSFWDDLDANPALAASFDALMGEAGHGPPEPAFDIEGGWAGVRTVVDVGGGTGAMLAALLELRPELRGTLVDLPRTVARARETFEAAGVSERVRTTAQSFFDPLPPGADLYLLRKVINDWSDGDTLAILRRCAEAAGSTARVVIVGGVLPDGQKASFEVEMVLLGGRTRSLGDVRALAGGAGLEVVAAGPQPAGFVVECRPR